MLEDKLLILKCRRDNQEAMCRIYDKYKNHMLTLAKGLVGKQATAEDIVHDVFVKFARSAGQFRLTGDLKSYLSICVSNRARDKIRERNRQHRVLESVELHPADPENPIKCAIDSEELIRLRRALSQIPYEQREVVILHIKGGLKFSEIAGEQGVSVSTIHGRYRYGLEKLRSLLNSEV